MTVADVLDRLPESERPLVISAMRAVADYAVAKAFEQYGPAMLRAGLKAGAEAVGQAFGSQVVFHDKEP